MRRHVVVISVVFALVVGAIVGVVALTTPVRRTPLGVAALSADEAALVTRYADHADSRLFVELVGADGATRWSDDLTPLRPAEVEGYTGVAATADLVLVLAADRAHVAWLGALDRATGVPRWWVALPEIAARDDGGRVGPMLVVDPPRVYAAREVVAPDGARSERLDAVTLADGHLAWSLGKAELGPGHLDVRLVGAGADARLVVATADGRPVRELDRATGRTTRTHPIGSILCASADGLVGLAKDQATWIPLAGGPAVALGPAEPGLAWNHTCGLRGGDVVMNLERTTGWSLRRVARADGHVVFDQALGLGPLPVEPVLTAPLAELPRFIPHALCGSDGVPWCELAVVDLDTGRVTEHHRLVYAGTLTPIIAPDRSLVWLDRAAALVAVDPATGRLGGAVGFVAGFEGSDGGLRSAEVRGDDLAGRALWRFGVDNAHPGDLPYAVLDLDPPKLRALNGALEADDAAARVREFLGPGRP